MNQGAYNIGLRTIAIIPARKGSKRLPNKNKRLLLGKPLICYTIEEALKVNEIDEIRVSTDDPDIVEICKEYPSIQIVMRSEKLSLDDTPQWRVIEHATLGFSHSLTNVLLLQPTSPLRKAKDIRGALEMYEYYRGASSVISVYKEDPITYKRNGAIFMCQLRLLLHHKGFPEVLFYLMPKERSIDIDYLLEFKQCARYLKNNRGIKK